MGWVRHNARVQPPQVGWNEVLGVLLNGEETMDFADAMNQLTAHMEVTQWTPKGLVGFPDLTGFERQDTDMPLLPVEYVKQSGCADYGFHGTIFFPTPYPNGDGGFLHLQVEYHD